MQRVASDFKKGLSLEKYYSFSLFKITSILYTTQITYQITRGEKMKYQLLKSFLQQQNVEKVTMQFEEIEKVLGFSLPKSAYIYSAWWDNQSDSHSHTRAWIESNRRTTEVDLINKHVSFIKER